jgi:uncharacterized SAM-binding protein YcdF (DUF218 family)
MKKLLLIIVIIIGFYFFKDPLLQKTADYLTVNDTVQGKADVLIVLGGEVEGERTERAVELYKKGLSDKLLFSDGTHLSWRIKAVEEMTALAKKLGVPPDHIYTEERSRSTYENALYTKEILLKNHWSSAVVVTTEWHTKRSKYIFDKVYQGSGIKLYYMGAKDKQFDSLKDWWKDGEKQQVILSEWAKLIVYWIKY